MRAFRSGRGIGPALYVECWLRNVSAASKYMSLQTNSVFFFLLQMLVYASKPNRIHLHVKGPTPRRMYASS
jgi:hypothetical protein